MNLRKATLRLQSAQDKANKVDPNSTPFDSNSIVPPAELMTAIDELIIPSNLSNHTAKLTNEIIAHFNQGIDPKNSCFVESFMRGEQIKPGTFLLGKYNNTPELHGP